MRLSEDIDFTTLTWVKSELDETLKQARHALEAYVEDPADASQMRFCATYLHQVQGTLRMVELYGAAMVTEEMEQLATALLEGQVGQRDEAALATVGVAIKLQNDVGRAVIETEPDFVADGVGDAVPVERHVAVGEVLMIGRRHQLCAGGAALVARGDREAAAERFGSRTAVVERGIGDFESRELAHQRLIFV
mgnify:CR=1 FL=1